jgi:hypothetical protein
MYKSSLSGLPIGNAKHCLKIGFLVNIRISDFSSGVPISDKTTLEDGFGEFPERY